MIRHTITFGHYFYSVARKRMEITGDEKSQNKQNVIIRYHVECSRGSISNPIQTTKADNDHPGETTLLIHSCFIY